MAKDKQAADASKRSKRHQPIQELCRQDCQALGKQNASLSGGRTK